MSDEAAPAPFPPDELAERRQQGYRWEPVMDDRTHPRCRCELTPAPAPWYRRALLWAKGLYLLWRLDRYAKRMGMTRREAVAATFEVDRG